MEIVIRADDVKAVTTRFGEGSVHRFTLVDTDIWDQQVEHQGPILTTAAATYSIVVAKRLKAKIYRGLSLSASNSSSFTVDPPLPLVMDLKSWHYDARKCLLLVAYFDDTVPSETDTLRHQADPGITPDGPVLHLAEHVSSSLVKLSPLKRQLENVTIKAGSPIKKALFQDVDKDQTGVTDHDVLAST
ncbi:hypothetical protein LIER_42798 [Lithospermum erythrorhizon]|uniref:EF-hand domain-containing protein n=1 Tax=Lithospermum erythrorhizon TaxID=34254 RepID=A0AAV3NZ61_LITER